MTETQTSEVRPESGLIGYLRGLAKNKDRAALAHLRRGLGKKPGDALEMYPYVGHFAGEENNRAHERAVFLTAALFAEYPDAPENAGDLGSSVKQIAKLSDSIERRFVALLDADAEDLHYYLRQMIALLKANSVPVNWDQLFKDIRHWSHDDRFVQRKWARSFWGDKKTKDDNNSETTGEEKL